MTTISLDLSSLTNRIDSAAFQRLASANRDLRLELNSTGNLEILPYLSPYASNLAVNIGCQLYQWNKNYSLGVCFSNPGFKLPNSAIRCPNIAWVKSDRYNALSSEQKEGFAPLAPDFVVVISGYEESDMKLQRKMQEYKNCGVRLGWLINPDSKQVEVYRLNREKEILDNPQTISGEDILPNLVIELTDVFAD